MHIVNMASNVLGSFALDDSSLALIALLAGMVGGQLRDAEGRVA